MTVTITVCTTCKFAPDRAVDAEGRSGGTLLAGALEAGTGNQQPAPRIVRHACLWACGQACAILIEGESRTGYLAGRFEPTAEAASAILAWAAVYGESADGAVHYAQWPEGMKGHFIARIPGIARNPGD